MCEDVAHRDRQDYLGVKSHLPLVGWGVYHVATQYLDHTAKCATCIDGLTVGPRPQLAMLPPISPDLLNNNPGFATLHTYLVNFILAPDGSTLGLADQTKADLLNELRSLREATLSDTILLNALEEISLSDVGHERQAETRPPTDTALGSEIQLPASLRDLVYMVSLYLRSSLDSDANQALPDDTEELMAESISHFQSELPQIASVLSEHLVHIERRVATVTSDLSPTVTSAVSTVPAPSSAIPTASSASTSTATTTATTTNEANIKRARKYQPVTPHSSAKSPPPLDTQITAQSDHINRLLASDLPTSLSATTNTLSTLHDTTHTQLAQQITHLERDVHGTRSRHIQARARYLAAVAQGLALKTRVLRLEAERDFYADTALMEKLQETRERARAEEAVWAERERVLEDVVREYTCHEHGGVEVGVDVFETLGRRYREIEEEIGTVKSDVEMLERRLGK